VADCAVSGAAADGLDGQLVRSLGTDVWPAAKVPLFSNGLNYYMHDGPHGMVPTDYDIYVQFLKAQFHPEQ
jgi:hypothetical protein